MSDKDAEILGIPEQDRAKYFGVDRAKGNNAPATKAVWHQFINVSLPNGDEVGVVAAWELPGQGAPSPEMDEANRRTERIFLLLLARKKRTVGTAITGNYAPRLIRQGTRGAGNERQPRRPGGGHVAATRHQPHLRPRRRQRRPPEE